MKILTTLMAKRCDNCPLCRYARENPATLVGMAMKLHGKVCPFWRAWQKEHGNRPAEDVR